MSRLLSRSTLIGIGGRAGAGKDKVAQMITQMVGYCSIEPFAKPLKDAVASIFMLPPDACYDEKAKASLIPGFEDFGVTLRHAQQTIGTEWGRHCINGDLWLRIAQLKYASWVADFDQHEERFYIIPDVRFNNEAQWVRDNGVLIYVNRPGEGIAGSHESEAGYSVENHFVIQNDGTLEDLRAQVAGILGRTFRG